MRVLFAVILAVSGLLAGSGLALADEFSSLKTRLADDGVPQAEVKSVFSRPGVKFSPDPMGKKLLEMYTAKYGSDVVRRMQADLARLGYFFGKQDGRLSTEFRNAVRAFQQTHGLTPDGRYTLDLVTLADQETQPAPSEVSERLKAQAEAGPPQMYEALLTPERLAEAKEFYDANQPLLAQVKERYGVPPAVTVGLLTVETRAGKFLGENLAINNLASMAASSSYQSVAQVFAGENVTPDRQAWLTARAKEKAAWAYAELKALFRYADQNGLDAAAMPGSIYGAIGVSQFMPSSLLRFGMDGDGDGKVDIFNVADAVHSMGNYLRAHGFTGNLEDEATLREALYRYNHSNVYVNTIMAISHYLRGGPALP